MPTGRSDVLALIGANPGVDPEKATTWMIGATIAPERAPGLKLDIGYFDINASPISSGMVPTRFGTV